MRTPRSRESAPFVQNHLRLSHRHETVTLTRFLSILAVVPTLCSLVTLPLTAQPQDDGDRIFQEARQLEDKARYKDDLKSAAQKYEEALSIFRKTRDADGEGQASGSLGNVYYRLGQFPKASEYYENAWKIFRQTADMEGEANVLINLSNVYYNWAQFSKALEYCEKSLRIFRKIGDAKREGNALQSLGTVYLSQGWHSEAVKYGSPRARPALGRGQQARAPWEWGEHSSMPVHGQS